MACLLVFGSAFAQPAKWITLNGRITENTWICFRKDIVIDGEIPSTVKARIAVDSKYWLWINGREVIFEGGLKRGPKPNATYVDEVDLAPFLAKGENKIAVLLCYFGKNGYSHASSGMAGLFFDAPAIGLKSDSTWLSCRHEAYGTTAAPVPNYRLPESNIRYDARLDMPSWQTETPDFFTASREVCEAGGKPWGELVNRPVPQFRNYGVTQAEYIREGDLLTIKLPDNIQFTPVIELESKRGGELVDIRTNHSFAGATWNTRAEYITKPGVQRYESLGWMNGETLLIRLNEGIKVNMAGYRQTGYDTSDQSEFRFDNPFFERFWKKAVSTLLVNMRDNFFDCPDRERAQWWGDVVVLMGECFYTLDPSIDLLINKAIRELCDWSSPEGVLRSPVPTGLGVSELPGQMLASIGPYGFWNYYMNTGDKETLAYVYPVVKKYLSLYRQDSNGLTVFRKTGWNWGDWGFEKDMTLIYAGWHALALLSAQKMADELGFRAEADEFARKYRALKKGFNRCWRDGVYRSPDYTGKTDDRVQALAVLAGIASGSKYPQILATLKKEEHASPYMEKYVMEALFKMGYGDYALERTEKRFGAMVNNTEYATLFEGWEIGSADFGGGTTNHAWSGGTITVLASEMCGIKPTRAGWEEFEVRPAKATANHSYSIGFPTVKGMVKSEWKIDGGSAIWTITVPEGSKAKVYIPGKSGCTTFGSGRHTITATVK